MTANEPSQQKLRWSITPKGKNPAHIGSSVIHPDGSIGKVVGGQSSVSFGGKQAACIGDKVECPGHTGVILQGAKSVSIGGKALAREGDKTSCGGVIMNGFPTITVSDLTKTIHGNIENENTREITVKLTQSAHSEHSAFSGMGYLVNLDNAEIGRGIVDESGELTLALPLDAKEVEIVFANGNCYILAFVEEFEAGTDKDAIAPTGFPIYDDLGVEFAYKYAALVNHKEEE